MERPYYIVDAFTNERFAGNAAAIVLDAEGLTEEQMQSIAAEFNLSETTFVLPPESDRSSMRFRWFTPTVEVTMCGHATIGGIAALIEAGRVQRDDSSSCPSACIDTLSGRLTVFVETAPDDRGSRIIWLDMPTPVLNECPLSGSDWAPVLNLPTDAFDAALPAARTQDLDALVFVKDFLTLSQARPDFAALRDLQIRHELRGLCLSTVSTLTPAITAQSRFFAPSVGIDEDPVTGSVHGPLAAYIASRGLAPTDEGTAALMCTQGKAGGRAGVVYALVKLDNDAARSVRIGGQAVVVMCGTLFV
ncbi:MAG: PhzF family phenazine biosynthesis protein [Phycisphaerales bacterium]|nr:MAG: PhzF family phenazine biosynthesis protein [Phycisphaerales bacterium]